MFFEKSENVSATHRTVVEIRTCLDPCESIPPNDKAEQVQTPVVNYGMDSNAFEKTRHEEKVGHEQTPIVQYRMVPRMTEIEVPEVHIEYDDTYVEVPVPFELPIIAPRQVPVEQVVQRNLPKPINIHTTQRYQMPRIQPKYYDVEVPIYVPSYVEVPVPSHFVALKTGEKFPEQLKLGPTVPHLPSCSVVPDLTGSESYATDIKLKEATAAASTEQTHQDSEQEEAGKALEDSTAGLPTLHRRGSKGSDLGYSSSALVQGAYPSVEFVAVSTRGSLTDIAPPSGKDKEPQLSEEEELLQENTDEGALLSGEQSGLEGDANRDEIASEYLCSERSDGFNQTEESPALAASPALVHAAA